MSAGFADPGWLLVLPLVAVAAVWSRPARPARRRPAGGTVAPPPPVRRGPRLGAALQAAAIGLLAVALAGPHLSFAGRTVDVAFLVDTSDSMGPAGRTAALDWVERALASRRDDDQAALALFGRDARVEYGLRGDPPGGPPAVVVDTGATDLARAARLAEGLLGTDHRRRAVLLTDGRQTDGDVTDAAANLARAGIAVDVVPLASGAAADVLVDEVRAPSRVRRGEAFDVTVVIANTGAADAEAVLVTSADGVVVDRRTVTAPPGTTELVIGQTAADEGTVRYEARLETGASTVPENDTGRAAVAVDGPPRVLVFEGVPGAGRELAAALDAQAVGVDLRSAGDQGFPALDQLLEYSTAVLVDVPVGALGAAGLAALDAFVRDAGRGLVAVGGESSFGLGGYEGTPLEELLPVFARVTDPRRRPSVAEALVVDTSGSMAACHCSNPGVFGPAPRDDGVRKTDIAKEAIARAVRQLESTDTLGVLAFNTASDWVIPLQNLPPDAVVDEGLARLHPRGNTDIPQAVRQAIDGLQDVQARLRHIVLFSDGFMGDTSGLVEVARAAARAGITLSVVGTGEGSFDVLRDMAEAGGGRYYPGQDLSRIPDIIAFELQQIARPIVNEGRFVPTVTGVAPATADLRSAPALTGYLATTAKPTARTLLTVAEERDPLLATWRAGLGTTVAWTSDAQARWAAGWVGWDGFARFWSNVVRDTFPEPATEGLTLTATASGTGLEIAARTDESVAADVDATATVTGPDGQRRAVPLERLGLDAFGATVPADAQGVYAVTVTLRRGQEEVGRVTTTAIRAYSAEYALGTSSQDGSALLARVADLSGGRLDPAPSEAFDVAGLAPGRSSRPLWALFTWLALGLAVASVLARRLRLERADWARARAWLRDRRGSTGATPAPRGEGTDALFAARDRARRARQDAADGDRGQSP